MNKVLQTIAMVMIAAAACAQAGPKITFPVSDTLRQLSLEWTDVDNDGSLDILVFSTNPNGEAYIEAYRNEGSTFVFRDVYATQMTEACFYVDDYDLDNRIDVIVSGLNSGQGRTKVFLNRGSFIFDEATILGARGKTLGLADLNMDGRRELIMSDDSPNHIMIYQQQADAWNLLSDTIPFHAACLSFHDFNKDFYTDIFISGRNKDGDPVQLILANRKGFEFEVLAENGAVDDAAVTHGDFNSDGFVDILYSGWNGASQPASRVLYGNGSFDPLVRDTTLVDGTVRSLFAADMTSDGLVDVNVVFLQNGDLQNINLLSDHMEAILPSQNLVDQRFGDADGDGDLDHALLVQGTIFIYENTGYEINEGPSRPPAAFATYIYDRLFIYWEPSADDHTPAASVTYDLTLQVAADEVMMGTFDLVEGKRTRVAHGNTGFDNFILLKGVEEGGVNFFVQAVDNAFHAGAGGICTGQGAPCEYTTETVNICTNETARLETQGESLWFSFTVGYLGKSSAYTYEGEQGDTLFSVTTSAGAACIALKLYNIIRSETGVRNESETNFVCNGETLDFTTDASWDSISWSSSARGFLSNEASLRYTVTTADTVILQASTATGCSLLKKTAIVISEPGQLIGDTTYQILKGQSVQLHAAVEGGVSYVWEPPTGLDQSNIANPVATPVANAEYLVTVADSIGCTFSSRVLILVENTAFVPTLFTPNQDGKNDNLRLYGLGDVSRFSFRIYNREGNLVYRTDDAAKAIQAGWDGAVQGILQPAGVYHWKIEGEDANGKRVLLNGKDTGSIVLIR